MQQYRSWLRPDGKDDEERDKQSDLMLIVLSVVGDDGRPFLNENDFDALNEMAGSEVQLLEYEVLLLNGFIEPIQVDVPKKSGS